ERRIALDLQGVQKGSSLVYSVIRPSVRTPFGRAGIDLPFRGDAPIGPVRLWDNAYAHDLISDDPGVVFMLLRKDGKIAMPLKLTIVVKTVVKLGDQRLHKTPSNSSHHRPGIDEPAQTRSVARPRPGRPAR